eukprot:GHVN01014565.1.p1 GENE.GHVN01014565.1~~GHVN01014565.1.p1  ORF type:complete len:619 (+),score=54.16 GHVN01014565.1:90-1946(+)
MPESPKFVFSGRSMAKIVNHQTVMAEIADCHRISMAENTYSLRRSDKFAASFFSRLSSLRREIVPFDFLIVCGSTKVPCHRVVVWANSAKLATQIGDGASSEAIVEGCEELAAFVEYMYTGLFSFAPANVQNRVRGADALGLDVLKAQMLTTAFDKWEQHYRFLLYKLACETNCHELQDQFAEKMELGSSCEDPNFLKLELVDATALLGAAGKRSPDDALSAALNWASHNKCSQDDVEQLLRVLPLEMCSKDSLTVAIEHPSASSLNVVKMLALSSLTPDLCTTSSTNLSATPPKYVPPTPPPFRFAVVTPPPEQTIVYEATEDFTSYQPVLSLLGRYECGASTSKGFVLWILSPPNAEPTRPRPWRMMAAVHVEGQPIQLTQMGNKIPTLGDMPLVEGSFRNVYCDGGIFAFQFNEFARFDIDTRGWGAPRKLQSPSCHKLDGAKINGSPQYTTAVVNNDIYLFYPDMGSIYRLSREELKQSDGFPALLEVVELPRLSDSHLKGCFMVSAGGCLFIVPPSNIAEKTQKYDCGLKTWTEVAIPPSRAVPSSSDTRNWTEQGVIRVSSSHGNELVVSSYGTRCPAYRENWILPLVGKSLKNFFPQSPNLSVFDFCSFPE